MSQAHPLNTGILYALASAALFGISTPFAKLLAGDLPPVMLAGILYLGSGAGLLMVMLLRFARARQAPASQPLHVAYLSRRDLPWFAGAVLMGGIFAPVLLMTGLAITPGSTAALLLNLEGVFTALLAWFVFRENFDRRILLGMLIVVASLLLSWEQVPGSGTILGVAAIAAACACWAVDNNLTRKVAAGDAVQIAAIKGLAAGAVNIVLAFYLGAHWPGMITVLSAALIGFAGYGISLVLFVLALRHLGTARTGAYFSSAPFLGAVVSLLLLQETPGLLFLLAFVLMAAGLWLHLTEQHNHVHTHAVQRHAHAHRHDEHHQHQHEFEWDGTEPHTHEHEHAEMTHRHPHYPDLHHRHGHGTDGHRMDKRLSNG